jgi:hypothetical protein
MKIIIYILALIVLGLSVYPCSDGLHCDEEAATSHNHSEDKNDNCSPFCACTCCGSNYVVNKVEMLKSIMKQMNFSFTFYYSFHYSFSYETSIWHPPIRVNQIFIG